MMSSLRARRASALPAMASSALHCSLLVLLLVVREVLPWLSISAKRVEREIRERNKEKFCDRRHLTALRLDDRIWAWTAFMTPYKIWACYRRYVSFLGL